MNEMTESTIINRVSSICFTAVGDRLILLNPEQEYQLYELNDSASILWHALALPKTIVMLANVFCEEYGGEYKDYINDIISWVETNRHKGLVTCAA